MEITIDAVYENGTLKLTQPIPLKDGQKVRVSIAERVNWEDSYGLCGFKGTDEEADILATDPEFDYPPPTEAT